MQDIWALEKNIAFGQGLFTLTEMAKRTETFTWEAKGASQIT